MLHRDATQGGFDVSAIHRQAGDVFGSRYNDAIAAILIPGVSLASTKAADMVSLV
jgi:hypothetical protein